MGAFVNALATTGGQAVVGAAGGVLNNALGMIFGRSQDKRQLRQQSRLQDIQIRGTKELRDYDYAKQMEMWENTNYPAQMEQLKKAGLNPGLIYGMSGGGGVTTGGSGGGTSGASAAAPAPLPQMDVLGMGIQAGLAQAQIKNLEAQAKKAEAEATKTAGVDTTKTQAETLNLQALTENTEAKTKLTQIESDIAEIDKEIKDNTFNDVINTVLWESRKVEREVQLLNNQKKISDATVQTAIKQIRTNLAVSLAQKAAIEAGIELTEAQTRQTITKIYQDWENLRIQGGQLTENERKGQWDRHINDMQESFKISADIGAKILQAMGLRELLKGGHTPISGFRR